MNNCSYLFYHVILYKSTINENALYILLIIQFIKKTLMFTSTSLCQITMNYLLFTVEIDSTFLILLNVT